MTKRFWIAALGALGMIATSPLAMADTVTVTPGVSLYMIARQYGVSLSTLEAANPGLNAWNLQVGSQITVPAGSSSSGGFTYTVQSGDTLWSLSQRYGVQVGAIEAANGIGSNIYAGEQIYLPTGGAVTSGSSSTPITSSYVPTQTGISSTDMDLLARVVQAEAGNQPFPGQVAVVDVILHRLSSPAFPHTINGVIYQPGAFTSVDTGYVWTVAPTALAYAAVQAALSGEDVVPGALYFYNPAASNSTWIYSQPVITQIGQHVFAV